MQMPEGNWTETLTDAEQNLAERLIDGFELRRLDTRDRDLVRHAIYYAMLFPVGSGTEHRFRSPPKPVANPSADWCDRYADWFHQGRS